MTKIVIIMKVLARELEANGLPPTNRSRLLHIYNLWKQDKSTIFIEFYKKLYLDDKYRRGKYR